MKSDNPIVQKAFAFALRIIKLHRHLVDVHKEYTLSREVLISGTHIGMHVVDAVHGESGDSFTNNMALALQKTSRTEYWLLLIQFAGYLNDTEFESIEADRVELSKMLTSIVKTRRRNA